MKEACEALKVADVPSPFSVDIRKNVTEFLHLAFRDAGEMFHLWVHAKNPGAPFPSEFLPSTSKCQIKLELSLKNAREFQDGLEANPGFYAKLLALTGSTKATSEKGVCACQGYLGSRVNQW